VRKPVISFLRNLTNLWLGLVILQIALGGWTIWSNKAADIATAHVAVGAITFAVAIVISATFLRLRHVKRKPRDVPTTNSRGGRDMKTAVIEPAAVPLERSWTMADLAQLVKARLTFLVLVSTAVGFYAGWQGAMDFVALMHAVLGTALAAAGAAALNQWWEHKFDAIMVRTQMRPIPSGRMLPREGLIVGAALSVGGVIYLALAVNFISAILAAATIGIYLFAYTPLKRITPANTLVGAIPGALPPLIGWAAARGRSRPSGLDAFRDSLSLAAAAFFRHRLGVSRRL
jgi:heme A synthase